MAVSAAGFSVVVRCSALDAKYPGGSSAFGEGCPNSTFCSDGEIARVGFMVLSDAEAFVADFTARSTQPFERGPMGEVAILLGSAGRGECGWVEMATYEGRVIAWLAGEDPETLMIPAHEWEGSPVAYRTSEEMDESLQFLGTQGKVEVYRDMATGQLLYVGRTRGDVPPAHPDPAVLDRRLASLTGDLKRAGAFERTAARGPALDPQSLFERAERLVAELPADDTRALKLQVIAARLLGRWDVAAMLSQRITAMRPGDMDSWLELTWALAVLRRFREAEAAARTAVGLDPGSPAALGNLAAVLLQQGELDESHRIVVLALNADPDDQKNRKLLGMIERARSEQAR